MENFYVCNSIFSDDAPVLERNIESDSLFTLINKIKEEEKWEYPDEFISIMINEEEYSECLVAYLTKDKVYLTKKELNSFEKIVKDNSPWINS